MRNCVLCALVPILMVSVAQASEETQDEKADRLFAEGRELLVQGRVAEACARLEESVKLSRAGGAMLNLAECLERSGRLTRAWELFREVEARASQTGRRDAEQIAHDRAARLEAKLPRLVILVETPSEPLVVRRDGERVSKDIWGASVPVDPGVHEVVAEMSGRAPFKWSSTVGEGSRVEVRVPALKPLVSMNVEPPSRPSPLRWVGLAAGATGLAAVGVGVGLFVHSIALHDRALEGCPNPNECRDPSPLAWGREARTLADTSSVFVIAGGVVAAGGLALFLFAPRGTGVTTRVGLGFVSLERSF